jgi:diadenosine tetraphosphate (Ap4A) HIT family hydrolase
MRARPAGLPPTAGPRPLAASVWTDTVPDMDREPESGEESRESGQSRDSCPFCERIADRKTTHSLGTAVAFPDAFPVVEGHTLIVPRRHEPDFLALTDEETADMWRLARLVCAELQARDGADAFNIGINTGPAAGQTVPHAHLHIIPRYEGDVDDPRGGVRWIVPSKARYWER